MFSPTWPRAILAIAVALFGFLLPQKIPLEYYSLNNPSSGLQYLEITCAANTTDLVKVSLDTGRGFNDFETIQWPISPSDTAYTYTFPLPDAPIRRLRLAPFETKPGELTITNFRIINRRDQEVRRFTKDDFQRSYQIAAILSVGDGWKIITNLNATSAYSDIKLSRPLIAEGMNERNFMRCLLSWSYLSLMIWILLLAVHFALKIGQSDIHPPEPGRRRNVFPLLFLAFVAMLFSAVGNRGLIKNSIRYAFYSPPALTR
jgi:hypothetical protein